MIRCLLTISAFLSALVQSNEIQKSEEVLSAQAITWEVQRWGATYSQLIINSLSNQSPYIGEVCRVNIRLHISGVVRRVTILPPPYNDKTPINGLLCNEVFLAVYRIKQFPMPNQTNIRNKLTNINLTVVPNE